MYLYTDISISTDLSNLEVTHKYLDKLMATIDRLIESPMLVITNETDIFGKPLNTEDPMHKALTHIDVSQVTRYEEVLTAMLKSVKGVIQKQLANYLRK